MSEEIRIFNRVRDNNHLLYEPLRALSDSGDDQRRAVVSNFMHDPKVSQNREKVFLNFVGSCQNALEFDDRLSDYTLERVQGTNKPDFADPENSGNRALVPEEDLASLLIVNGLSRMFMWAKELTDEIDEIERDVELAVKMFRSYPNSANPNNENCLNWVVA